MALQLPNIYTLGQVQVSSQPLAQLQGQLLAKKQAREEALDKYFENKTKELSRKGIADNDYDNYNKKLNGIKDYWYKNKDSISKGGLAQRDFESMVDDLKDFTYQSINKKNEIAKVAELVAAKKIEDDKDVNVLSRIELPIGHPDRLKPNGTPYGLSDFKAYIPMPEVSELKSFWDFTKEGMKPKDVEYEKDAKGKIIYTPVGPDSFDTKVKFKEKFSNDQINAMADKAAQLAAYSDRFQKYFNLYLNNPTSPEFAELKQIHMEQFPGNEMDTPQEVARALSVLNNRKFVNTGEKVIPGKKKEAEYKSALTVSRQKAGGGEVDLSEYDLLGQYAQAKGKKSKGIFGIGGGSKIYINKKDIDPKDYELIASKDVQPLTDKFGEEYFEVDPNTGDWKAENATISAASVARRLFDRTSLSEEKRGATGFKPSAPIPGKAKDKRPPLSSFKKK